MSSPSPTRFAVLVSGSGTNLQALLDAQSRGELAPATIALVISNRPGVRAIERAQEAGVPVQVIDHKDFDDRRDFEEALLAKLEEHGIEAVVLAGFMRVLTEHFVGAFPNRILNTHPALCPAFPGMHAARQALEHGAKVTGCTVHFVDTGVDTGPIIAQAPVPIRQDDDEGSLQKRIQREEHRLLPHAARLLARGALDVRDNKVLIREVPGAGR